MAAIVCELCGSNDVVKEGGFFVCQHCGTKYSLEEAKKMLGTVQIDNSNFVERYLQNARRAKEKEDWEETEKYYNMVEANDPDNIEAIFYSAYGKAKSSLSSDDVYKRQEIFNSLQKCISIIDDHYDPSKEEELRPIIMQISADILDLSCSNFVYTRTTDSAGGSSDNSHMTYALFASLNDEFITTILNIIDKLPSEKRKDVGYLFQIAINHCLFISNSGGKTTINHSADYEMKRAAARKAGEIHALWHRYDPTHEIPSMQEHIDRVNAAETQEKKSHTGMVLTMIGIFAFIIIAAFTGG